MKHKTVTKHSFFQGPDYTNFCIYKIHQGKYINSLPHKIGRLNQKDLQGKHGIKNLKYVAWLYWGLTAKVMVRTNLDGQTHAHTYTELSF